MIDYKLALMTGIDIPIPECQVTIHQPKIREIALIGESNYHVGAASFCIDKSMMNEDENVLKDLNNFHIFMTIMSQPETKDKKEAVQQLAQIIFPEHKFTITPQSILLLDSENQSKIIDSSNFDALQNIIRDMFCLRSASQEDFNPVSDKAREIAEKLKRGRQKIAEERNLENGSSIINYTSALSIGLHIPLQQICELTIYQLYDLVQRYMLYISWDLDLRSRLAGGKPDKEVENWMKNIH